jgi:restriction endonuclease
MENELPKNLPSNVLMQIDDDTLNTINVEDGKLPKEVEEMLKQTAMRTILYHISENYREELENVLGKDNIDENGQPNALLESTIPYELYEFICKQVIGTIPPIEIEITNDEPVDETDDTNTDSDI